MLTDSKQTGRAAWLALALCCAPMIAQPVWAEPPADCPCHQGGARGRDHGSHHQDMADIHALFADPSITRTVREIPGGVETLTESSSAEGARKIQKHVAAMQARLEKRDPIHARDPLFAELFKHAHEIQLAVEQTARGVRVRETSTNPYVTKLIRAHAAVVSKFLENGRHEMHVNHQVPAG